MYDFIQVNLLPAEYRVHRRALKVQAEVILPALLVVLVGMGLMSYQGYKTAEAASLENEIRSLDSQIQINAPIEQEIQRLSDEKKIIVGKIMALERITVNRAKWVRLMEVLCRYMPPYMWLSSIRENNASAPTLVVQGKTKSFPEVAAYMADLRQSTYVTAVELTKIEQVDDKDNTYGFEVVCTIDPNAGLTTTD